MVSCIVIVDSLPCVLSLSNAVQKVANQWLARCSSGVPRTRSRASLSNARISSLISARRSSWFVLSCLVIVRSYSMRASAPIGLRHPPYGPFALCRSSLDPLLFGQDQLLRQVSHFV